MALHDELTGLPSRHLLLKRGREALRLAEHQRARVAFGVLEVSDLEGVAGIDGPADRDRVLLETARRIRRALRTTDLVGRIGDRDFGLVFRDLDDDASARAAGSRVTDSLSRPFLDGSARVSHRMGLALYPDHGSRAEQLLGRARDAAGRAEEDSGPVLFRRPGGGPEAAEAGPLAQQLSLSEFEEALEAGDIELFFQPIFRIRNRQRAGLEALLRWPRPDGEVVESQTLLSLAREGGLVEALDRRALGFVLELAGHWPDRNPPDWLSVNLSVETLAAGGFHDHVKGLLNEAGIDPGRLVVEIAMREVLASPDRAREAARELREMGVRLALDDVGAGPVPLEPLREGPVDFLKIDPVLVRDLDRSEPGAALVRGMVELGHALDARVVAEGVESEAELRELASLACDFAQGFHLAEPRPFADLE